jgi:hypothetical protein
MFFVYYVYLLEVGGGFVRTGQYLHRLRNKLRGYVTDLYATGVGGLSKLALDINI